ncbi:calcium-binding protein [Massilia mucilaginosa]|nr:calcium-binding protein [Massilia mucilaginosa]
MTTVFDGTAGNDTLNGSAADDTLNSLGGNDQLFGFAGNDILHGGAGNDFLNGGLGDDSYLFGRGDGRDIVYMTDVRPMSEVNTLRLKEGVLPSELAFDMTGTSLLINIVGGSDQFRADGFFYGSNTTNSANPLQQIVFADGTTWNLAEIQARLYAGTDGADVRGGTYLGDAIGGLGGNDVLDGRGGDDTIEGGAGTDTLIGGLGNDQLFGGAGNDSLSGNDGNDKLDGGIDDDRLDGAQGADTLDGGAGNDIVEGGLDNDLLLGNDGNDRLYGNNGDDTLDGGAGNDTLDSGFGKDVYLFGKGDAQDTISGGMTLETGRLGILQFKQGVLPGDVVVTPAPVGYGGVVFKLRDSADQVTINSFLSNDDPASPYNPVQEVRFANGTSWNLAAIQAALYAGTKDADHLIGTVKGELITGQAGNDWIDGKGGDDTIDGGLGNDVVHGGLGNDTYLFGRGDGQDDIRTEEDAAPGKLNILQFKAGIVPGEVILSRNASDLIITLKGSTDKITVTFFLNKDDIGNAFNPLQQIRFDDGTAWDGATILAKLNGPTEGNDTISGTGGADLINGLGGADRLDGLAGNDTLDGAHGADTLSGGDGDDLLAGGLDDDTLDGGDGDDRLDGGLGNDLLQGGLGNNEFDGGQGNDTLNGGFGDDVYLFGRGDGSDSIWLERGSTPVRPGALQFKPGVLPSDLLLTSSVYSSLVIKIRDTADQVSILDFLLRDDSSNASNPVREFRFADGTRWNLAAIQAAIYAGTADADRLDGTVKADLITGQGGDDWINGKGGDDTLDGGTGNDALHGGEGNDTYLFGRGDGQDQIGVLGQDAPGALNVLQLKAGIVPGDILLSRRMETLDVSIKGTTDKVMVKMFLADDNVNNPYNPLQQIRFADGTTWDAAAILAKLSAATEGNDTIGGTSGDDFLSGAGGADRLDGMAGNDTLDGGSGKDILNGGNGGDTFLFGKGDGQDRITVTDGSDVDTLQFKPGVLPGDVLLEASPYSGLIAKIKGSTDQITVESFMPSNGTATELSPLQLIRFADGTSWNMAQIESQLYGGSAGADRVFGTVNANAMFGLGGADFLSGNAGNDTIEGGLGNDTLSGGGGNDIYVYGSGDGADKLMPAYNELAGKIDALQFKAGIAPADITLATSFSALLIKIKGGTGQIRVEEYLSQDNPASGTNPLQEIRFADGTVWNLSAIQNLLLAGTNGAEEISGTFAADTITGLAGADSLSGKRGDDTLDGGAGNDTVNGCEGSDTYLFGRGDGADVLGSLNDWAAGKIDTLQFKAGILPGDISLTSSNGVLTVKIAGSSDSLSVNSFLYEDNTENAYNPLQQIRFADGTSWNLAAIEATLLAGSAATGLIDATLKADVINGLAGNDIIDGKGGDDTIRGGAGDDQITGGAGSDTYMFGRGDGQDSLLRTKLGAEGKLNTLQFDAGISGSDLQLSKSGTTLLIKIVGGSDQLTVSNFLSETATPNPYNPLQHIVFADGASWDLARINAELAADSTSVPAGAAFGSMAASATDIGLVGVATPPLL